MKRKNKYAYDWVVQGDYGYGWDDLTHNPSLAEAKSDLRDYRNNERGVMHRIICRREPNA